MTTKMKSWQQLAGCTPYSTTHAATFKSQKIGKRTSESRKSRAKQAKEKTQGPLKQRAPGSWS